MGETTETQTASIRTAMKEIRNEYSSAYNGMVYPVVPDHLKNVDQPLDRLHNAARNRTPRRRT